MVRLLKHKPIHKHLQVMQVSNEAIARQAADAVLQAQINAIADAFQYKGNVGADGQYSAH